MITTIAERFFPVIAAILAIIWKTPRKAPWGEGGTPVLENQELCDCTPQNKHRFVNTLSGSPALTDNIFFLELGVYALQFLRTSKTMPYSAGHTYFYNN